MTYDLDNAPDDSYIGRERDLADALTDDTLEFYEALTETHDEDAATWALFLLLMMNYDAARAMTIVDEAEWDLKELLDAIQDDARGDSSEAFGQRLAERTAIRKTIRNFATQITKEN